MTAPKLRVAHVSRSFGAFEALHDVNLEVAEGSVLALLGPSGSGKSTLLKIIAGHDAPDRGDVLIDGDSVVGLPPERIPTATVFQHYALFPHYNVFKNVAFGLRVRRLDTTTIRNTVEEVLETVGLGGFESRDVATLSGGERQRVAMARALAVSPAIMLMDEPLGALDRLIRVTMQQELAHLLHQLGITTVYVTHDQHEAFSLADRVAVMEQGRVHQVGTPLDIYREPVDRFVAHFVGGTNFLEGVTDAVADDGVTLRTKGGLVIEGRVRPGASFHVGQEVVAMIRPEEVTLGRDAPRESIDATVVEVSYVGDITHYVLRLVDAHTLTAKELGRPSYEARQSVRVRWATSPLILER